jgi:NAD/NADP transhydrogenase beta subunit
MIIFGVLSFTAGQDWNDRTLGIAFIVIVSVLAGIYGIAAVLAIGGGDAPVSISFLNSLSGFSTSAAGFMLSNKALVVSGAFVGCSGIILTLVMCKAMNRSVMHVLVGGFGEGATKAPTTSSSTPEQPHGSVTVITAEDVVEHLTGSRSVVIVPGYGMVSCL